MDFSPKRSIACEPPKVAQCVIDPTIPPNPMIPGNNLSCSCVLPPDFRCPDGSEHVGDGICVRPPTVSCVPPLLWSGSQCVCPNGGRFYAIIDGRGLCTEPPQLPVVCGVTVHYNRTSPSDVWAATPTDAACDAAGLELALAVLLARLLGAPR
jgi:hypothetical protein